MALEKYMAIAGLALSIFFVAEVITLFNFMINPADNDSFGFEAAPKLYQFISLSIAPATIMMEVTVLVVEMVIIMETWNAYQKTHVGILLMMYRAHFLDVYGIMD